MWAQEGGNLEYESSKQQLSASDRQHDPTGTNPGGQATPEASGLSIALLVTRSPSAARLSAISRVYRCALSICPDRGSALSGRLQRFGSPDARPWASGQMEQPNPASSPDRPQGLSGLWVGVGSQSTHLWPTGVDRGAVRRRHIGCLVSARTPPGYLPRPSVCALPQQQQQSG